MAIGTGTAAVIAAAAGLAGSAMQSRAAGAGGGGMSWIAPPKEAQQLMAKEYGKEKAEIGQEAQVAKAGALQALTGRGLTGTTMQEAYQTRISKDTANRLESLADRYALQQYGAYQPVIRGAPGPGPFEGMLSALGQSMGKANFLQGLVETTPTPAAQSAQPASPYGPALGEGPMARTLPPLPILPAFAPQAQAPRGYPGYPALGGAYEAMIPQFMGLLGLL